MVNSGLQFGVGIVLLLAGLTVTGLLVSGHAGGVGPGEPVSSGQTAKPDTPLDASDNQVGPEGPITAPSTATPTGPPDRANAPPTAVTGGDRTVHAGSAVTLSLDRSRDPDDNSLSYAWTQTAGPQVALGNTASQSFSAPDVAEQTEFVFRATVTDAHGETDTATVTITAKPPDEMTFYQVDLVAGTPLATLGPADSSNFYNDQNRLIQYLRGNSGDGPAERGRLPTRNGQCVDSTDIRVEGDAASVSVTVGDRCHMTLSLVSYQRYSPVFNRTTATEQRLVDSTTESLGPGTHTLLVDLPL